MTIDKVKQRNGSNLRQSNVIKGTLYQLELDDRNNQLRL